MYGATISVDRGRGVGAPRSCLHLTCASAPIIPNVSRKNNPVFQGEEKKFTIFCHKRAHPSTRPGGWALFDLPKAGDGEDCRNNRKILRKGTLPIAIPFSLCYNNVNPITMPLPSPLDGSGTGGEREDRPLPPGKRAGPWRRVSEGGTEKNVKSCLQTPL